MSHRGCDSLQLLLAGNNGLKSVLMRDVSCMHGLLYADGKILTSKHNWKTSGDESLHAAICELLRTDARAEERATVQIVING